MSKNAQLSLSISEFSPAIRPHVSDGLVMPLNSLSFYPSSNNIPFSPVKQARSLDFLFDSFLTFN